jgi:hypothetical protein
VPSARRGNQLAALVLGGAFAAAGLSGCSTTQEKAAAQRAESARILDARDKRQQARRSDKHHADGPESASYRSKIGPSAGGKR